MNFTIDHSTLGTVEVHQRQNSGRLTARWKMGQLRVNAPVFATHDDILAALDRLSGRLLKMRPTINYFEGQYFRFPEFEVVIKRQHVAPTRILAKATMPTAYIEVGDDFDFADEETTRAISTLLCRIARKMAPEIILPVAREAAHRIAKHPTGWLISSGHRVLGTCNSRGVISLSYILVFLPPHLRQYIICHELAHLSEMNHSARFHRILDDYLDGREQQLIAELRQYNWPVLRK